MALPLCCVSVIEPGPHRIGYEVARSKGTLHLGGRDGVHGWSRLISEVWEDQNVCMAAADDVW